MMMMMMVVCACVVCVIDGLKVVFVGNGASMNVVCACVSKKHMEK